jgi:hypothetical protein
MFFMSTYLSIPISFLKVTMKDQIIEAIEESQET